MSTRDTSYEASLLQSLTDPKEAAPKLEAVSVSDESTAQTMRDVYEKYDYVLDPHGAVGFYALEKYLEKNPHQKGFFLETAHPSSTLHHTVSEPHRTALPRDDFGPPQEPAVGLPQCGCTRTVAGSGSSSLRRAAPAR